MIPLNHLSADEGYAFKEFYEVKVLLQGTDRPSIEDGMQKAFEECLDVYTHIYIYIYIRPCIYIWGIC